MDKATLINKRKGRYMAQTMEAFEELIEPHLGPDAAGDVQAFKGLARERFKDLATDAGEIASLAPGAAINGVAQNIRDRLGSPVRA